MAIIKELKEMDDFSLELEEDEGQYTIKINSYYGNSKEVVIPTSIGGIPVTVIGSYTFLKNDKLRNVILPENIKVIENGAFTDCTNLKEINLPESLVSIEDHAFENCECLAHIKFPENLVSIESYAFGNCDKLTNITIPKGLADIESNAFSGCKNLKEFIVDERNPVYTTCEGVLFDKNMTTLIMYPNGKKGGYVMPDSITTIAHSVFNDRNRLTQITFPAELMAFPYNSFYFCELLSDIMVDKNNPLFSSVDGVLFDKEGCNLLQYPQNKNNTVYTVPDNVVSIMKWTFYNCKRLTKLILPESLRYIDDYTFQSCEQLSEITLPMNLMYIGEGAFKDCTNLKTITLSKKTKTGYKTFSGFSGQIIYRD